MDVANRKRYEDSTSPTQSAEQRERQMEPNRISRKRLRHSSSDDCTVVCEINKSEDPCHSVPQMQEESITYIDISKKHHSHLPHSASVESFPVLNTLITPDSIWGRDPSAAADRHEGTIRLSARQFTKVLDLPDLKEHVVTAIKSRASVMDSLVQRHHSFKSVDSKDNDHNRSEPQISATPDKRTDPKSGGPQGFRAEPVPRLRPNATCCSNGACFPPCKKASRSDPSCSSHQSEGFDSPSTIRVNLNYVLLEELLMANEEWNKLPKQAKPLNGTCNAEFTNTDYYNMLYHLITRAVKQHRALKRFKQLPILDQIALMKGRARTVMILRTSIMHHWKKRKLIIEYPGCPQVDDDVQRHLPASAYPQAMRLAALYPDNLRTDSSLITIMCALALFDIGSVAHLIQKGDVRETRNLYLTLLKEYLQNTYGEAAARVSYEMLISWVNCVALVAANMKPKSEFDLDPLSFDVLSLHVPYLI